MTVSNKFGLGDMANIIAGNMRSYAQWYDKLPLKKQINEDRKSAIEARRSDIYRQEFDRLIGSGADRYKARDKARSIADGSKITVNDSDLSPYPFSRRSMQAMGWSKVFRGKN